ITGGGRGMGRDYAESFARRGAKVVVADVGATLAGSGTDAGVAQEVVDAIAVAGGTGSAYTEDLSTEAGARGAIKHALEKFGRIDVLVHNAGISGSGMVLERETLERFDRLYAINTRGAFAMLAEAWPAMLKQKYGRIVLVGSTAMYGIPTSIPYSSAKG